MPKNKNYIYFDNKYIIGKSDVNNDNYDILSFARRDLKHAEIPSFIKRIGSSAFSETLIENIVIPFNVEEIGERIFDMCKEIKKVEFTTDSNIKSIGKKAFYDSTIEILNIPSSVIDLKDGWCAGIRLKKINVIQCKQQNILMINDQIIVEKSDIKSDDYDVLVYAKPDINEIILPSFIKKIQPYIFTKSEITSIVIPSKVIEIGKHAFQNCDNLQNIEFVSDSELQIIGKKSFADLRIKKIRIPSSVTKICEQAFAGCYQLKKIQIPNSSKLQIIEFGAFRGTKIKTINIPSNILELKNGWCAFTSKLIDITIIPNEQQNILLYDDKFLVGKSDISSDEYDVLHFIIRKKYKKIIIPSFIKIISSYSLQYDLFVKSIFIPSKATQIKEHSFIYCENLTHIEIPNNSNLSIIEKDIFSNSLVSSLYIPSHVKEIRTIHFNILQIIEFADDVNINDNNICTDLIDYSDSLIIMIPVI